MIDSKDIVNEIRGLYDEIKILSFFNKDGRDLNNNPLHLQINVDKMITNLNIIKNLISLYINAKIQETQKDSKITTIH